MVGYLKEDDVEGGDLQYGVVSSSTSIILVYSYRSMRRDTHEEPVCLTRRLFLLSSFCHGVLIRTW